MDVHQLELFLAVMSSPSMSRAAEKVHLSPAAVSLQMHKLAAELHADLFVRSGKKFLPTPAAIRLAQHARSVVFDMRELQAKFENDPLKDTRPFYFATGATTLIYRLGRPLRLLRKRYSQTELRVIVGSTEEIVAGLRDRQFDLGLISLPVQEKNFTITPLFDEELLFLCPSHTRVSGDRVGTVRARDLSGAPFVLYGKQGNMRSLIDKFFNEVGLKPRVVTEAADTEVIKRLVESGFGYSILPEYALKGQARFFRNARIAGHRLIRRQALATVRTEFPRPLTESIAHFLLKDLGGNHRRNGFAPSNSSH